jgi:hypothetical protein
MHCILQIGNYAVIAICAQDESNTGTSHGTTVAVSGVDIQADWRGENPRQVSQCPAWLHKQGIMCCHL